jgi:hypothetical protein
VQLQFGFLPTAFQCASGYPKDFCGFILRQAFVEQQIDHFTMILWESANAVVELAPLRKVVRFLGGM